MAAKRGLTAKQAEQIVKQYKALPVAATGGKKGTGKLAKAFKVSPQMVYYYARQAAKTPKRAKKKARAAVSATA